MEAFIREHPYITLFIALAVLSTIGRIVKDLVPWSKSRNPDED